MRKKSKLSILTVAALLLVLVFVNSCDTAVTPKFLPTLTTNEITQITQNTANSGGNITSDNGFEVTARGVCWSLNPNPTINDSLTKDAAGTGAFTSSIKNLLVDTTYYVRAYATNKDGTAYGLQVTFKTLPTVLPGLTTTTITDITASEAIGGGNVTFNGGSVIIARGICWSVTANPTITNDKTLDGNGSGIFTSNLTNLITGTTYYVRAYATNSAGTAYGSQITFKTLSIPTITTTAVTAITATTANIGGNITLDGGTPVTARGVCWSTATNPTILNFITTDGNGKGSFTSSLTGLTDGVTYYVRAYATNSVGTSYGNQVSFTTGVSLLTDIDGNSYKTVTIGTQTWMAENLKVTKYRDGSLITNSTIVLTTAACQNTTSNSFGLLYNWHAVSDNRNIAPIGWHVPTDTEWKILANFLGGQTIAGLKLRESGTIHWTSPNSGATNSSGFTAIPLDGVGNEVNFWSSTSSNTSLAYLNQLLYNSDALIIFAHWKYYYGSIRCIKD
jgi:uncharacterized protein (TIGR02145 family)